MPRIGPITLAQPFCQAGLAGYSDRAMRLVARRRGCPYAVTEALLDTIMLSGGLGLKKSIDINDEDHPIAGQIIGSDPETMSKAAVILHDNQYDVIDLNFACPVKKIKNKARGGHMLFDTVRGLSILRGVRDALPSATLSISLRRGFDDSAESEDRFYELVDEAFALDFAAVRVHGRTVEQKYQGQARWETLKQIKQRYPTKTILGSGDVFTAEDVVRMLAETGVDIVWIARGAIGNPWIFQQAAALLVGATLVSPSFDPAIRATQVSPLQPPSIHAQREALQEHFSLAMQLHGEQLAGRRMRKMGIKYARFHPERADVKTAFINIRSLRDWTAVLDRWYATDGAGVWPAPDAVDEVNADASGEAA
jgi:nifR3 family TIM-barrel protein